jgi:hypothetical protein
MYKFMYVNICSHTYVNKTYSCTLKKSMYTYIHIYTYIYLYIYIYVYMYMYVCIHLYIYAYLCTKLDLIHISLIDSFNNDFLMRMPED